MSHVDAAAETLADAASKGAKIPAAMQESMLGIARAWDAAEMDGDSRHIAQLSARMFDWVTAVMALVPVETPLDAFSKIANELDRRRSRKTA